jgi:acid phosphatase
MRRTRAAVVLLGVLLAVAGCSSPSPTTSTTAAPSGPIASTSPPAPGSVPSFQHVVVVVEENHGFDPAMGMPYLRQLRRHGTTFTDSHGVGHPSQPNYLALWSGSTHGITSDACPQDLGSTPSLGSQLLESGRTVAAYAEGLPSPGSPACTAGSYARRHDPLADFSATAGPARNLPFSAFPSDYAALPSVSLVVPNLDHDGHNGTLAAADAWLRTKLSGYATWAGTHDSLLIVTFDEDGGTRANRILTVFTGAHVRIGTSSQRIDHVRVLHTIERSFGLPLLGPGRPPISGVWRG